MIRQDLRVLACFCLVLLVACGAHFLKVDINELKTYTSPTNAFQVDAPSNWKVTESSRTKEAVATWVDDTGNGKFTVDVLQRSEQLSEEGLTNLLLKFMEGLKQLPEFSMEQPAASNGGQQVNFTFKPNGENAAAGSMQGRCIIRQQDNKVSVTTLLLPKTQVDELKGKIDMMISSLKVNSEVDLPN